MADLPHRHRRSGAAGARTGARDRSGHPRFHARQIYRWIHRRGVTDFAQMTDLSAGPARSSRPAVQRSDAHRDPRERRRTAPPSSCCGLADGKQIESVFIPDTPAQTFCISTQVGCAMRCAFCLTGKMGIVRNLTAGEIVGQVRVLARANSTSSTALQHRPDGHGRAAAQLRRDDEGAADAGRRARPGPRPRRVTLSTVGVLPALERLARSR
jgi:23S rRNA (adenine2503-C2)-methyltransferase